VQRTACNRFTGRHVGEKHLGRAAYVENFDVRIVGSLDKKRMVAVKDMRDEAERKSRRGRNVPLKQSRNQNPGIAKGYVADADAVANEFRVSELAAYGKDALRVRIPRTCAWMNKPGSPDERLGR
jgi:hypothetical protein